MASEIEVLEDTSAEESTAEDASAEEPSPDWEDELLRDDVYAAAAYGDMEKLQRLVEAEGRPVDKPDGHGYYALQWAALNNHVDAAQYILEHGAQVNTADNSGQRQTALHWSAVRGHVQVAELLMQNGADVHASDSDGYQVLHIAAQYGQTTFIYQIVAKWNVDSDALDARGRSPLHWAAYKGFPDTMRLLLCLDADMAQQDRVGHTPLHWAAIMGNLEACKVLVQAGKKEDLMVKEKYCTTPDQLAAINEHPRVQNYLYNAVHHGVCGKCGGNRKPSKLAKLVHALLETRLPWSTNFRKLSTIWRGRLVWFIAIVFLATYIQSVISENMTTPLGLFAWTGVLLATAGLIMFYKCRSKDPGYIKRNTRDTQNRSDCKPLFNMELHSPELLSGNWSQLCIPCKIVRPVRSEHCSTCNRCVEQFHHHCPWVSKCIGKNNKGEFFMFITLEILAMIITGSAAFIRIVRGPPSPASFDAWPSYSAAHSYGAMLFLIMDVFLFVSVAVKTIVPALQIARNMATYLRGRGGRFRNPFNQEVRRNLSDLLFGYSEDIEWLERNLHNDEETGMTQMTGVA